jgi:hypothetical protein
MASCVRSFYSAPDSVIKVQGWMLKRGHFRRNWLRRWFELKVADTAPRTQLCYYDKKVRRLVWAHVSRLLTHGVTQGGKLKGTVVITASTAVFSVSSSREPVGFRFKIVRPLDGREYFMMTVTDRSRTFWIQAIQVFTPNR